MGTDTLFEMANLVALLSWLLLIIIPTRNITRILVGSGAICALFAITYLIMIAGSLSPGDFEQFSTLEGLTNLFSDKKAVMAGWLHYLAFDLFVGIWIVRDAKDLGIKHLYLVPSLLLTFMMGPLGLLTYLILKSSLRPGEAKHLLG